jgi:hypothetical protein
MKFKKYTANKICETGNGKTLLKTMQFDVILNLLACNKESLPVPSVSDPDPYPD